MIEVTEFTDPACSWAWGTEPKLRLLRWRFDDRFVWRTVVGGLIGDMNKRVKDFDPVRMGPHQSKYWREAFKFTGMSYPVHLEWMLWSTEPELQVVRRAIPLEVAHRRWQERLQHVEDVVVEILPVHGGQYLACGFGRACSMAR